MGHSLSIATHRPNVARVHVLGVSVERGRQPVYNLTVDGNPEFYANGVLVHNCDTMRYAVRYVDGQPADGYSGQPRDLLRRRAVALR